MKASSWGSILNPANSFPIWSLTHLYNHLFRQLGIFHEYLWFDSNALQGFSRHSRRHTVPTKNHAHSSHFVEFYRLVMTYFTYYMLHGSLTGIGAIRFTRATEATPENTDKCTIPDRKVHGANMGPTWVLSAPDGPHIGPMNLAIRDGLTI